MEPLISVTVPIYKVEKYLARCIDSLLNQTYGNYEIILVDDGSPDRCGEICDAYAAEHEIIKVLHKENGGLSDARNRGVEIARGEYISFVDSDDCVAPDYLETLYKGIVETGADMSFCSYYRFSEDRAPEREFKDCSTEVMTGREACRRLLKLHTCPEYVIACAKLIPAETVRRHSFPAGMKHEDEAVTYRYFADCEKAAFIGREMYGYYINPHGIMGSRTRDFNGDYMKAQQDRTEFFLSRGDRELATLSCGECIRGLLKDCAFFGRRSEKLLRQELKKGLKNRIIPAKVLAWTAIYAVSPKLYRKLYAKSSPGDPVLNTVGIIERK